MGGRRRPSRAFDVECVMLGYARRAAGDESAARRVTLEISLPAAMLSRSRSTPSISCRGLPSSLPPNAAVNMAQGIKTKYLDPNGPIHTRSLKVSFSMPEAPSALLVLEHLIGGPVDVTTTEIPKPDPRLPRRRVKVQAWRLKRSQLYTIASARRDAEARAPTRVIGPSPLRQRMRRAAHDPRLARCHGGRHERPA